MNRKRRITLIALGAAVSLLLGSGLLALASDSVVSEDNSVSSGTFAHDLKAARSTTADGCAGATYSDGPFTALISDGQIDLVSGEGVATQPDYFCLRNAGTTTARLEVTFQSAVDSEVGPCLETEAAAGDTSCVDGEAGELRPVLNASFNSEVASTSPSCTGLSTSFGGFEGAPKLMDPDIGPDEICILKLFVFQDVFASETENLQAQTDRVQWDIVFTLVNVAP